MSPWKNWHNCLLLIMYSVVPYGSFQGKMSVNVNTPDWKHVLQKLLPLYTFHILPNNRVFVRFQVLMAASMKIRAFRDVVPRSLVAVRSNLQQSFPVILNFAYHTSVSPPVSPWFWFSISSVLYSSTFRTLRYFVFGNLHYAISHFTYTAVELVLQ
jgi:hypothetical protein